MVGNPLTGADRVDLIEFCHEKTCHKGEILSFFADFCRFLQFLSMPSPQNLQFLVKKDKIPSCVADF